MGLGRTEAARFAQIRSVVWLAMPQDDQKQTSDGCALSAPGDDPAFGEQQFLLSVVLADVDAIQNFLVLRRHLGEELYLIDPCYASFAPFACVSSKEARQLKQTFD